MRKILLFIIGMAISACITIACRFAPNDEPGDTVAAGIFAPHDVTVNKTEPKTDSTAINDSTEIGH